MESLASVVNLALVILLAGVATCSVMHFSFKKSWTTVSVIAAVFIWLALVVMRYPVQTHPINVLERHLVTFIEALKYFSLSKPFAPLTIDPLPEFVNQYYCLEIVLSVAAPACTAVVVLALLQQSGRIRRWLMPWRPVYYFSELNEKSFSLAQNISAMKRTGKDWLFTPILIFCKVDAPESGNSLNFRNEARKLDAVFYKDPIYAISKSDPWFREVKVFLIDMDENANMSAALKMKDWIIGRNREDHTAGHTDSDLMVFSTESSAELLFGKLLEEVKAERIRFLKKRVQPKDIQALPERVLRKLEKKAHQMTEPDQNMTPILNGLKTERAAQMLFDREESRLNLHLINETRLVTQKLLIDHPLYEAAQIGETDNISVLVIGCGYLGTQFLKTAMLCGMMDSYNFKIQVIDQQAGRLEQQFFHDHPFLNRPSDVLKNRPDGLRPAVAPVFHQAMVCTDEFDRILNEHCSNCNYIVIATGDDQLNVTTAQHLQCWYARRAICGNAQKQAMPLMFAAVRSPERYDVLKTLEEQHFRLFANNMEVYSAQSILERPLDAAAAMFNNCYNRREGTYDKNQLLGWDDTMRQESKRRLLRTRPMTQRSNLIAAMHSLYKLQDLLHWYHKKHPGKTDVCRSLQACAEMPEEQSLRQFVRLIKRRGAAMYDLEHRRWTLFHALNGWDVYPMDTLTARLETDPAAKGTDQKVHKDENAMLHACMIPTSMLSELEKELKKHTEKEQDFQGNDRAMCVASLFGWLELAVEKEKAKQIRTALLKSIPEECRELSIQELLDHVSSLVSEEEQEAAV